MPGVYPVCCGLEVHQAPLTACLRCVSPEGQRTLERRECGTPYGELLALRAGLAAHDGPVVALESPGVYWRPGSPGLVGTVEGLVGNARDLRPRPGKKTDKAEAPWSAELLAHGLLRPRCVPPPALSARRDLRRTRVALVQPRTHAKHRVPKVLEATNIQRARGVTELCGTSGRQRLAALLAGERDPKRLSGLALGR